jgi:hypothetical protein
MARGKRQPAISWSIGDPQSWGAAGSKQNNEYEGTSHDVIDNKGSIFLSHDMYDNKLVSPSIPRCL